MEATAFVWRELVRRLEDEGVTTWGALHEGWPNLLSRRSVCAACGRCRGTCGYHSPIVPSLPPWIDNGSVALWRPIDPWPLSKQIGAYRDD